MIRFSKERVPDAIPAIEERNGVDVLMRSERPQVLVIGYGQLAGTAVEVGERLSQQGIGVTVVDPVWALPLNPELMALSIDHDLVITLEDGGVAGGVGSRLAQELRARGISTPLRDFGVPQEFHHHDSRAAILERIGLTAQTVARVATERVIATDPQAVSTT